MTEVLAGTPTHPLDSWVSTEADYEVSEDPTAVSAPPSHIVLACLDEEEEHDDDNDQKCPVSPIVEVPEYPSNASLTSGATTTNDEIKTVPIIVNAVSAPSTVLVARKVSLGGNKFRFSDKEVECHRRRSSEKRYRVPEFEDHLKTNLGDNVIRRKSSGYKYQCKSSKTVLEIIQTNNPGISVSKSLSSSRKHSLRAASGEPMPSNMKALEEAFGNAALDQAALSLGNSFSSSFRSGGRKASSANSALLNHNSSNAAAVAGVKTHRKLSSPAILEKRVLQGLAIAPELTIPNIHIPSPKEDLGEVVMDGSIKAVVMKVLQLD
eukprot:TRINITY_DN547_c0_g1_i1.p1 TRINITY_DN547_c0_g1~~TRINITY_DN547_c0_g1_i1.p1  ORF type:complete len:322 (+),score=80.53 TRINITY_DN547_c0_g1_i1:685-1650(+)